MPVATALKSQLQIDTSGDKALLIDRNGDGVYEEQRPPDVCLVQAVDFTAPARINDLAVTNVSSGTATLLMDLSRRR